MKNNLSIIIVILFLFCCSLAASLVLLSGCDDKVVSNTQSDEHIHNFGEWVIFKEPSCTENGESERYCLCGERQTEVISSLGHDYKFHDGQPADCTHSGWSDYRTCLRCDYSDFTEIESLNHDFGEWEVTKKATCTEKGIETRVCSRDGAHTETRELEMTPHTAGDWIIENNPSCETCGSRYKECIFCQKLLEAEEIPELGHDFGEWTIACAPTCTSNGTEIRVCVHNENHVETRTVKALGHSYEWTCDGETHGAVCEVCGATVQSSAHEWEDGVCKVCGYEVKLDFAENGEGYSVCGIGNVTSAEIEIPSFYKGLPVTAISYNSFSGCSFLTGISIPEGITAIGANAFSDCVNLKYVSLPDSVEIIGESAFKNCSSLEEIILPENLTEIGGGAFSSCTALKRLVFPSKLKSIGCLAFEGCDFTYVEFENPTGWQLYDKNGSFSGCVSENYLKDFSIAGIYLANSCDFRWERV